MATTTIFELVRDGKISPELYEFEMALNTYWLFVYDGIEKIKEQIKDFESLVNDEEFMDILEQANDHAGNLIDIVEDLQNLVCESVLESIKEQNNGN